MILLDLIRLMFSIRAAVLEIADCEVFEDLSAICDWGIQSVPW